MNLNRGRALRRAAVVITAVVAVVLVLVLGSDRGGPTFTGPTPGDPVTALCRASSEEPSSACASAYFACRDHKAGILRDANLPRGARPRRIAVAYVKSDWSDWDPPVQDAAKRGCRAGLGD